MVFLKLQREVLGSSRVVMGDSGNLREPLLLPRGSQASIHVVRGTSGFFLNRCREIGPHLELK